MGVIFIEITTVLFMLICYYDFAALVDIILDEAHSIQEDSPGLNAKFKFEFIKYVDILYYVFVTLE